MMHLPSFGGMQDVTMCLVTSNSITLDELLSIVLTPVDFVAELG